MKCRRVFAEGSWRPLRIQCARSPVPHIPGRVSRERRRSAHAPRPVSRQVAGHARSGLGGGTVPDMDGCRRAISRVKCNKRLPGVAFKNLRHVFLRRRASSTRRGPPFTSRAMSFRRVRLMAERSMPLLGRNWHSRTLGGGRCVAPRPWYMEIAERDGGSLYRAEVGQDSGLFHGNTSMGMGCCT